MDNKNSLHDRGTIDAKGHWKPPYPCNDSPIFKWPLDIVAILRYLFWRGYLFPKMFLYTILSVATFFILKDDLNGENVINAWFVGKMFVRNLVMVVIVYGGYHLLLYTFKVQGDQQKYNPAPQATNNKRFLFNNQVYDNMFHSLTHGVLIWTAYEVFYVWALTNDFIPYLKWTTNPVYFVVLLILLPLIRETHFYLIHRLLHTPYLLKKVHSLHHRNINPAPWSGLSMHWVEHLGYFSSVLIHFIIPSHPVHFLFTSLTAGLTPAAGHIGFEGPIYNEKYTAGDYFHYLHHKHVSCNFGTGNIPLDRWFKYFYAGEGKYVNLLQAKKKK